MDPATHLCGECIVHNAVSIDTGVTTEARGDEPDPEVTAARGRSGMTPMQRTLVFDLDRLGRERLPQRSLDPRAPLGCFQLCQARTLPRPDECSGDVSRSPRQKLPHPIGFAHQDGAKEGQREHVDPR